MKPIPMMLVIGLAIVGWMIGYLAGASHSPLGTTIISTIFGGVIGVITGLVTTRRLRSVKDEAASSPGLSGSEMSRWGLTAALFSVLFVTGTLMGGWIRTTWPFPRTPPLVIPWDQAGEEPPRTPKDAWVWITFARDAAAMGLDSQQIKALYAARLDSLSDEYDSHPWPSYSDATVGSGGGGGGGVMAPN